METFFNLLQTTELRVLVLAVLICVLTALLKTPLKRWAKTRPDGASVTRFVTFLPVVLGFGLACLYERLATGALVWGEELFSLWIRSATLSLAIYAFVEKFVPSKQKILSEEELRANLALLEQLRSGAAAAGEDGEGDDGKKGGADCAPDSGAGEADAEPAEKLILKGGNRPCA